MQQQLAVEKIDQCALRELRAVIDQLSERDNIATPRKENPGSTERSTNENIRLRCNLCADLSSVCDCVACVVPVRIRLNLVDIYSRTTAVVPLAGIGNLLRLPFVVAMSTTRSKAYVSGICFNCDVCLRVETTDKERQQVSAIRRVPEGRSATHIIRWDIAKGHGSPID